MASPTNAPDTRPFKDALREDLAGLRRSPKDLWLIYGIKFLESVAYFAIYNLLNVYLSEDLGYTDVQAGLITSTWLTGVSVIMFFSGFIADSIGIRRAMIWAVLSVLIGRAIMAVTHDQVLPLLGLFVSTWGVASMMPTMTAAVRRYTNRETVAFGFSFFYVVMNVGALVAPLTVGALRKWLKEGLDVGGLHLTTSQVIFSIAAIVTALAAFFVLRLQVDTPPETKGPRKGPAQIFAEVSKERAFWGFMLFVSLLVLVRLIFQHAHQTWPKYTMRVIDKDFDWAFYWSINPAMVIILTPVVTALTRKLPAFLCIVGGAFITAGSVFFLTLSDAIVAQVAFVATLSIGECIWSPRLYEYTATIAPPGREASYMGLSQVPMFFAKMAVGGVSGVLLSTYCPENGDRQPHLMWAIIGLTTLVGPIMILLLRRVIEGPKNTEAAA
jgi:dipeptide/tripeptide permease